MLDIGPSDSDRDKSASTPNRQIEDDDYVRSTLGRHQYIIGRTQFTKKEREVLGVKTVDWTLQDFHLQVKAGARPFRVHEGSLVFPQNNEDYGNIIGFAIHDMRKDGKNGFWQLPRENPLGTKSVCIKFKGKKFRSFDVSIWHAFMVRIYKFTCSSGRCLSPISPPRCTMIDVSHSP